MIPSAWPSDREIPAREWSPPPGTRVISADDHLIEPTDLWSSRVPAKDRDAAPRLWRDDDGVAHLEVDGRSFDVPGLNPLLVEGRAGMLDQELRLKDMDAEGIDEAIVFPQKALGIMGMADKDLLFTCCEVYNEWLAEWCAAAAGRLHGVAILPVHYRPEATESFIAKVKALGLKAMELPSSPRNVFYNSRSLELMWDAIEASGIPLSFHIGEFPNWKGAGALGTFLTNYPHPESSVGGSVEIMRSIFDTVDEQTAKALVGGNAAELWGL